MKRKAVSISGIVLVALVIAGLWAWRWRAPGASPTVQLPAAAGVSEPAAASARSSGEVPAEAAGAQQTRATPQHEPTPRKPTLGLESQGQVPTAEELERNRELVERSQKAWDEHIAPLLYPPGGPNEGSYLDSVTCDQAVEAQLGFYEAMNPTGSLDQPWLHLRKRINYDELARRRQTWSASDLDSNRALYDWLVAQPEDPTAPPGDFWLHARPSDGDATTRREFLRQYIRSRETSICTAP